LKKFNDWKKINIIEKVFILSKFEYRISITEKNRI